MSEKPKTKLPWFYDRLSKDNCKLTKPRQVILDILYRTSEHLSAEEIYIAAHKVYPKVGLATIYRNLGLLVRVGLVLKFDFGDNKGRYELAQDPGVAYHHYHLICRNCNKVIDYSEAIDDEEEFLKRREKNLSKKYDFRVDGYFIDFVGLCKKCNNKG